MTMRNPDGRSTLRGLIRRLAMLSALLATGGVALAAEEEPKGTEGATPKVVEFPPFTITMIDRNRVRGLFRVSFVLEVRNQATLDEVETLRPRLQDAYLAQLNQLAQYRVEPDRAVDTQLVANTLQASTDFLIGTGTATVLLQDAMVRPR